MAETFKNKYRTSSTRMPTWDYGASGLYYVTICTKDRQNYFGTIAFSKTQNIASLHPTEIGEVAYNNWLDIPKHFSFVQLDEFVVMPNHIHGVLFINKPNKQNWEVNQFGPQTQNLASVIRGYKASVKAYATKNNIEFSWQPKYYDHVILNEKEHYNITEYIYNNPDEWLLKGDVEDNLYML